MDWQQIAEMLSQMEAKRKVEQKVMEAHQARMEAIQAETEAIRARTRALQDERTEANSKARPIETNPETVAIRECEEQSPKEVESEVERWEVPKEKAAEKSSMVMKKRPRGRRIRAGRHVKPTKLARGDGQSRERLVATCRKVSCHAALAWRKRNLSRKIRTRVNCGPRQELGAAEMRRNCCTGVEQRKGRGTQKRLKNETRLWKDAEGDKGMRSKGVKEPLHLRKGKKVADSIGGWSRRQRLHPKSSGKGNEIYRNIIRLAVGKRATEMSTGLLKIKDWTMWRGRPPPKRKKKLPGALA
jgi:hypothetical protein